MMVKTFFFFPSWICDEEKVFLGKVSARYSGKGSNDKFFDSSQFSVSDFDHPSRNREGERSWFENV